MTEQQYEKMKLFFRKIAEIESEIYQCDAYLKQGTDTAHSGVVPIHISRIYGNDFYFLVNDNDFHDFLKSQIEKKNKQIQQLKIELNNI